MRSNEEDKFFSSSCNSPTTEKKLSLNLSPGKSRHQQSRWRHNWSFRRVQQERALSGWKPGEEWYLPGLGGRGIRSFSKGPQGLTCSIPNMLPKYGVPPYLVFLKAIGGTNNLSESLFFKFLYKLIHSLLAVTLCKFLNILVPQFPHKMKQYTKGSCENQIK